MTVTPLNRSADPPAFDDFYRHYFVRVLALVRRHFPGCDAEEIAQETMARCFTNYASLDPARDPWPWVNSVARNAAIDSLRRNRRMVASDELPEVARGGEDATYDAVLVLERRHCVRLALKRLRPADRQLVEDHDLEGMAYTEMAALRDITPNALRQQLFRARNRLALELRRVGATLGVVPVAVHHRAGRAVRRVNDLSHAMGPAGASALSIAAVASVATVATALGGPTVAGAAASARPAGEVVAAVDRSTVRRPAPPAPAPAPAAASTRTPALRPGVVPPDPPPPIGVPVQFSRTGDPTKPGEDYSNRIVVDTPVGPFYVEEEADFVPGYGILCWAEVAQEDCPDDTP